MFALLISTLCLAGSIAGVEMPDSIQSHGRELHLNGMGLRERLSFDIYVAGLYTPFKSSDPKRFLRPSVPKQIHCEVIFPRVPKARMVSTMTENLKNNPNVSDEVAETMTALLSRLDDLEKGDQMIFTYHPKDGLVLTVNKDIMGTSKDPEFIQSVLGCIWGLPGIQTPQRHARTLNKLQINDKGVEADAICTSHPQPRRIHGLNPSYFRLLQPNIPPEKRLLRL